MTANRIRLTNLPAKYPRIFPKGPLTRGFEHGDGWTTLIEMLCARVDLILQKDPNARFEVLQVKEKFGGLRFYYQLDNNNEETGTNIREAVERAVSASMGICESCGCPAISRSWCGWLSTRCSACRTDAS